jgi:PhnB protein
MMSAFSDPRECIICCETRRPTMTEQRVIPMLAYEDASRAAEWIGKVFGFREAERFHDGVGTVTDVVLELDGATVIVGHPSDAYQGPRRHAQACALARLWLETSFIVDGLVVYIDDVDTHFGRAKRGGAKILSEPETNERQRQYRVEDLEGHRWMFAQRLGS